VKWLVGRPWFWALTVGALFALPLLRVFFRDPPKLPPVRGQAPAFTLTRESGQPYGAKDLEHKVWVAARFNLDDKTPGMKTMHDLERHMRKLGDAFMLVSVAVDPDKDTTAALTGYAQSHKTNPRRWALVTGPLDEVKRVRAGLELDPSRMATDPLVLVDGHGRIRGIYDMAAGTAADAKDTLDQLMYDAALLVNDY
jgi:cytochrome oxidase Cu insertion factor (SCO1/SenC/PrrC family)